MLVKDQKYLDYLRALLNIQPPSKIRYRLAACLVKNNRVISVGFNHVKTDPFQQQYATTPFNIYCHAEVNAIKKALRKGKLKKLNNTTLYVARVRRDGTVGLARPCAGCMRAIAEFSINRVVWTV